MKLIALGMTVMTVMTGAALGQESIHPKTSLFSPKAMTQQTIVPPVLVELSAILANDLLQVFALAPHNWALVHATITWMLNFAPPGSYGSAQAVTAWHGCGGLQKERWE